MFSRMSTYVRGVSETVNYRHSGRARDTAVSYSCSTTPQTSADGVADVYKFIEVTDLRADAQNAAVYSFSSLQTRVLFSFEMGAPPIPDGCASKYVVKKTDAVLGGKI